MGMYVCVCACVRVCVCVCVRACVCVCVCVYQIFSLVQSFFLNFENITIQLDLKQGVEFIIIVILNIHITFAEKCEVISIIQVF